MSNRVLILGATSGIAKELALALASDGYDLVLAGRNLEELRLNAADIQIRFNRNVRVLPFDALQLDNHQGFWELCISETTIDGVVLSYGYLGDQTLAQTDLSEAVKIVETNFTSCVSILSIIANYFEKRRTGFMCVLSSVAGDRGRQSNYTYGSTKGALSIYAQGMRNRLAKAGVQVTTIKPGFIDTSMTYGKDGMFLVASPQRAARDIVTAIKRGKDVAYVPGFWRAIMLVIRLLPESIFKRLSL